MAKKDTLIPRAKRAEKDFPSLFGKLVETLKPGSSVMPLVTDWVLDNGFLNDRGLPLTFDRHKFLLEPYNDWTPEQGMMKASQIGGSLMSVIKVLYAAKFKNYNVVYTLPSGSDVKRFEASKVSPIINLNPTLRALVDADENIERKKIGNNFIYFQGTITEQAALMVSSDLNVHDESDRSNQERIDQYISRQTFSPYKGRWMFSNPSGPNVGASAVYERSDKKKWHIACPACNERQELTWPESIDIDNRVFVCKKCRRVLSDSDRIDGVWVAANPGCAVSGYHISQLMAPWITAGDIIDVFNTKPTDIFFNYYLGLPYISDNFIDADVILKRIIRMDTAELNSYPNAMGVDVGIEKYYVIGNRKGIFEVGMTKDWDEIERLMNLYKTFTVIDIKPDPTIPRKLARKYPGKVFLANEMGTIKDKENFVFKDKGSHAQVNIERSALIDDTIDKIINGDITFINMDSTRLKEYIKHWSNIYSVMEEDRQKVERKVWRHSGPDHFVHATDFYNIARTRAVADGTITYSSPETSDDDDFSLDSYDYGSDIHHWTEI